MDIPTWTLEHPLKNPAGAVTLFEDTVWGGNMPGGYQLTAQMPINADIVIPPFPPMDFTLQAAGWLGLPVKAAPGRWNIGEDITFTINPACGAGSCSLPI